MNFEIRECRSAQPGWSDLEQLFPGAMTLPAGDRCEDRRTFLAAISDEGRFTGGAALRFSALGCGPLAGLEIGIIDGLEVRKEHRRRGIGSALLRRALHIFWDNGLRSASWTVDHNNSAALEFYRRRGCAFVHHGAEPRYTVVAQNPGFNI